jgi:hypothetical protein
MTVIIRAHFDGKVIVPDEPVALPQGTPLTLSVSTGGGALGDAQPPERQRAAFEEFVARARVRPVPRLPDEATRREGIYED